MFWKFDLHTTSHIDTLLEREDVTLTEVMDEEDVLQECKAQNRKLVDFLLQPQCMEDLLTYITQEPSNDMDEKIKYKYPNISCELLTSDVGQINDKLGEDESLLMKLYGFLQNDPPLNPLLASFFSKVLSILISRKPEQIVEFLQKRDDFVDLIINHIGTSAIMDFLLRMLTCIEPQQLRQEVLNWLNKEKIIQRLVDTVQPSQDEVRHSNASQSLCEIIRLSRDQLFQLQSSLEPDPLLATLEKQETVEQLLSNMLDKEKTESSIVSVIQILLTLLETRRPAFEGHSEVNHPSYSVSQGVLEAVIPQIKNIHQLLLDPPKRSVLKSTWGVLDPPVGNARLHVVRLVASLLQTNTHTINQELIQLNTLTVILDMYFKYIWNNFLHLQVEICIALILAIPPSKSDNLQVTPDQDQEPVVENLVSHLFQKCHLIQRILEVWASNEKEQAEGGRRRGYMGHLTRIANSIVHNTEQGPNSAQIRQLISELQDDIREGWDSFVAGPLAETNKKNTVDLVNTHHIHSSSDDEVEFKDGGFHQDSSLQQAFSDYQMQQMTSNFIEQFGFNDEEFTDQDDVRDVPFDRISDINFSLKTNENASIALFEACCKERIQQFEDAGSDEEDIWNEKDVTFAPEAQRRPRSSGSTDSEESTDSEDDEEKHDPFEQKGSNSEDRMEVETSEAPTWTANFDDIPMETGSSTAAATATSIAAMPAVFPVPAGWSSPNAMPGQVSDWADFTNVQETTSPKGPIRSSSPVAMETSTEAGGTLGFSVLPHAEVTGCWGIDVPSHPAVVAGVKGDGAGTKQDPSKDHVTETSTNSIMKETVSLTVDAKSETAVFKSEEETLPTSDVSTKYNEVESAVSDVCSVPLVQSASNCQKESVTPSEEDKVKYPNEAFNGPLEDITAMEETKDHLVPSAEAAVNGPA